MIEDDDTTVLTRYQHSDHLGSSCLETDENGVVISYEEYHPFGTTAYQATLSSLGSAAKRYRYCGKERDEESGLYYYGARYYASWLGRFVSVDPKESKYFFQSSYAYAENSPVTKMDWNGEGTNLPVEIKKNNLAIDPGEESSEPGNSADPSNNYRSLDSQKDGILIDTKGNILGKTNGVKNSIYVVGDEEILNNLTIDKDGFIDLSKIDSKYLFEMPSNEEKEIFKEQVYERAFKDPKFEYSAITTEDFLFGLPGISQIAAIGHKAKKASNESGHGEVNTFSGHGFSRDNITFQIGSVDPTKIRFSAHSHAAPLAGDISSDKPPSKPDLENAKQLSKPEHNLRASIVFDINKGKTYIINSFGKYLKIDNQFFFRRY